MLFIVGEGEGEGGGGPSPPPPPSLAWTCKTELSGVEVNRLMGKGQSRDIFGVKTPPPTH